MKELGCNCVDEVNMYTMLDSIVKREDLGVVIKKQCGDCAYKYSNYLHHFANYYCAT